MIERDGPWPFFVLSYKSYHFYCFKIIENLILQLTIFIVVMEWVLEKHMNCNLNINLFIYFFWLLAVFEIVHAFSEILHFPRPGYMVRNLIF